VERDARADDSPTNDDDIHVRRHSRAWFSRARTTPARGGRPG